MKRIYVISALVIILAVFLVGCEQIVTQPKETPELSGIKKFASVNELKDYLEKNSKERNYYGYFGGGIVRGVMVEEALTAEVPMAKTSATIAADYSQTNVQVEGVDEADFVKNDDKYIYVLSQDTLVIVDAYPAEDAKILSETNIKGRPANLFVNKDRLVVFSVLDDEKYIIPEYGYMPVQTYAQVTHAYVYDISDRENPKLVNDFSIDGYYFDSRMIGDYVYFIAKEDVYYGDIITLPVIRAEGKRLLVPDVYYFDNPEDNFVFHTIASFNIKESEDINAETFLMGYSNTLYVSRDNIYIGYQKNPPYGYYQEHNEERFYKVVVPMLPGDVQNKIKDIKSDGSLDSNEKWQRVSSVLEDMYNSMDKGEKEELVNKIEEAISEYETKLEIERRKTVIHKIEISKGDITYKDKGEVSGYLLNQFSLDEFDGNLRVATTTEIWTRSSSKMYNNVYVLDEDMKVIGNLEEIAPDERIYSTRFIGDRLYMVTFKRIDPLFVIDLSDPEKPEILGKLKLPGYSDYLHPYDKNHIIGIGKETADNEWGGVSVKGVKLALFDVSDVSNPELVDEYEIGEAGTDSEALSDHKAFLFDKDKNILVIPVREVKGEYRPYEQQRVWQGAYVFGLSPEDGIKLKGKITHNEWQEDYMYYYGSPYAVRRALYMDDVLYTVSAKKIMMNDIGDIEEGLNEVKLPYEIENYYPMPYKVER